MKYLTQLAAALAVVTITSTSVVKSPMVTPGDGKLELLILHNNDMHARFEQTSQLSGACTAADREAGKCYGGFPRVAHVVKEARRAAASGEGPPVLYLNAGDTYTGTAWFTIYKWKIAAEFINALQPDAVSLGNNELNAGSSELSPFLENLETNIVATNVIVKGREDKLQKSLVFDIKGVKIGLVGYLALDAKVLDSVGNVEYIDEVIALKEEVAKLQEQNINIIIALGHAGLDKDIEIAREVEGVDLVIAGKKNTFMWNGASAIDQELNEPIEVIQESGKRVPVIRSSAYNTYLGQIYAEFDAFGEITALSVDPIVLDESVKQDNESVDILNMLHAEFSTRQEEILGQTAVVLDGDTCKYEECNLGNLITDAMVYYHATRFEGEQPWTDASIAIIPAGIINASIAPSIRPASITLGDILTVLPVESNIVTVTMSGTILLQVLEHAVSDYDVSSERFLQLSGIRVEYNLENEIGSRVVSAVARCSSCYVPEFYSIDSRSYTVMMPASLANGDYGYSMLVGLPTENLEYDEVTCTAEFIRQRSLVYPEVAGRITILNDLETTETPLPPVTDTPTGTTDPNTETTELDTATTEPDTATTEPDSQTTDPDTDTTEPDTATTEPDSQTTEPDTDTTEPDTATTEPDTDTTEPDTDTTEPDSETTETDTETTEPDSETTEPDSETTEPDTETTEPDSETTEPDSEITEPPVTEAPEPTEPPVTDGPISTPEPDTEPTDLPGTEGPTTTPEPDSAIALSSTLTVLLLTCIPFLMS